MAGYVRVIPKGGVDNIVNNKVADLEVVLNDIKGLVYNVGQELRNIFITRQHLDIRIKSKGQIVTIADNLSNEMIIKYLREKYPYINILSEEEYPIHKQTENLHGMSTVAPLALKERQGGEAPRNDGDINGVNLVWVVDPLDGTTNFAMHNAFWNVSVSLNNVDTGEVLLGVVYAPMYDKLYYAAKGYGAYVNGRKLQVGDQEQRSFEKGLHVFCYGNAAQAKISAAEYYRHMLIKGYQCRQLGAAQLELAYVAEGILDTMYIAQANVYDVAAGVLLIREAGGVVYNEYRTEWGYIGANTLNQDVVAARFRQHLDNMYAVLKERK